MAISVIVAFSKNNVIGKDNALLWRLSNDLKRFKSLTTGHAIVMGRKTYESIGRPLPNRNNIVLSKSLDAIEGGDVVDSLEDAIKLGLELDEDVFVIGGGKVYYQAIDLADNLYITEVDADISGDTYFPDIKPEDWEIVSVEEHTADEKNEYNYRFVNYRRKIKNE